jgi:hypothetical protein
MRRYGLTLYAAVTAIFLSVPLPASEPVSLSPK